MLTMRWCLGTRRWCLVRGGISGMRGRGDTGGRVWGHGVRERSQAWRKHYGNAGFGRKTFLLPRYVFLLNKGKKIV